MKKSEKRTPFTLRMEQSLRADLEDMEKVTAKDFTATIHDAVKWYKQSPEFRSVQASYQAAQEAARKSLGGKK